jgi:hypothetical protein
VFVVFEAMSGRRGAVTDDDLTLKVRLALSAEAGPSGALSAVHGWPAMMAQAAIALFTDVQ